MYGSRPWARWCEGLLHQRLQPFWMMKSDQGVFDGDPTILAELAECAGDGFPRSAGHRGHLLVGQQERKPVAATQVFADLMSKLQQKPPQACGHSLGQRNATCILQRKAIFLADTLDCPHLRLFMAAEEAEKPLPLHWPQLGAGQ